MKSPCKECKNYKSEKELPNFQVTFHNWCELFHTPSALVRTCDYSPTNKLDNLPTSKVEYKLNEFFNIFLKKSQASSPPFTEHK